MPMIKTADLTGSALNYAVELAEGAPPLVAFRRCTDHDREFRADASASREQGGPILDREDINVLRGNDLHFPKGNENGDFCEPLFIAKTKAGRTMHGRTRLEAGMRCHVANKLGEQVNIPEELL